MIRGVSFFVSYDRYRRQEKKASLFRKPSLALYYRPLVLSSLKPAVKMPARNITSTNAIIQKVNENDMKATSRYTTMLIKNIIPRLSQKINEYCFICRIKNVLEPAADFHLTDY